MAIEQVLMQLVMVCMAELQQLVRMLMKTRLHMSIMVMRTRLHMSRMSRTRPSLVQHIIHLQCQSLHLRCGISVIFFQLPLYYSLHFWSVCDVRSTPVLDIFAMMRYINWHLHLVRFAELGARQARAACGAICHNLNYWGRWGG